MTESLYFKKGEYYDFCIDPINKNYAIVYQDPFKSLKMHKIVFDKYFLTMKDLRQEKINNLLE